MIPRILFIITGDPRSSPRPAEAVRIAAGVGTWPKMEVIVYLRDAAVLALSEPLDELVDEDHYTRYLPMVAGSGRPIFVQQGAPLLRVMDQAALPFEEINDQMLAELTAGSTCVVRF